MEKNAIATKEVHTGRCLYEQKTDVHEYSAEGGYNAYQRVLFLVLRLILLHAWYYIFEKEFSCTIHNAIYLDNRNPIHNFVF